MQNKKRKILAIALIIGLIAIISVGTLAWFTAKDTVENVIKLADDFEVDVYETDEDGNMIQTDDGATPGQTYEGIMPGDKLHKDPTVRNTGTHTEWVRVNVTLDNFDVWQNVIKPDKETGKVELSSIFTGFDGTAWKRYDNPVVSDDGKSITYTYYLDEIKLEPLQAAALFTGVTIPGELTSEQAAAMNGEFKLTVQAEAMQTENLPEEVTTAHAAFALLTPAA